MIREIGRYDKELGRVVWFRIGDTDAEAVAPYVIQDTVEEFESLATPERKKFTSMSAYKRHLAELGYEIAGKEALQGRSLDNPAPFKANREEINASVQEAIRQVKWNEIPFTEKEREQCTRENRMFQQEATRRGIRLK